MKPEKYITIIRHGQTDFNKKKIVQGSGVDAPLNQLGFQQAIAFWNQYGDHPFDLLITSSLQRTKQTIQPFIDRGIPLMVTSKIDEINWGEHEGKESTAERIVAYQHMISEWGKGNLDARLPKGESAQELINRLSAFLTEIKSFDQRHILICTHGRAIRCLMMLLKSEDISAMEKYQHNNTGVFQIVLKNEIFDVKSENDLSHLKPLISWNS